MDVSVHANSSLCHSIGSDPRSLCGSEVGSRCFGFAEHDSEGRLFNLRSSSRSGAEFPASPVEANGALAQIECSVVSLSACRTSEISGNTSTIPGTGPGTGRTTDVLRNHLLRRRANAGLH